jgi:hypothetical protein
MTSLTKASLLLWMCSACGSTGLTSGDGGAGGDAAAGIDGLLPTCSAVSPSGYACDPWSTHLYVTNLAKRQGSSLRLDLMHSPEYEGHTDDMTIPPEHNYFQVLTVDLELTDAVRHFLCIAFAPTATPASFDASSPSFSTDVAAGEHDLLHDDASGTRHVANLIDICGSPTLASVLAPTLATGGPVLPDVVVAIPLAPKPLDFTVGTEFHGWLARGVLYVDEDRELSPDVTLRVVAEGSHQ